MPTMLILTGPQGSGNHLFSKVFAQHPDVYGWDELNQTYWIGHDQEPFAKYWYKPELLHSFDWSQSEYYITSISCPYVHYSKTVEPDYQAFIKALQSLGIDVKIAVIGRDQNILEYQQTRVRGQVSLHKFMNNIEYLLPFDPVFISQELLYLYKDKYVQSLSAQLNFPVSLDVTEILKEDANSKYFKPVDTHWLDEEVKRASTKKE
ncbi:hypothetical protein UFOVP112_429 [uncultured Caudovirales phage]|uniref:Uncharacterized protein n=1 Tax=uncultured Caudovirales phage TaxID=2100421 RepID=A0A6J5L4T4_9CAUD|nr:hypothetical protein UFOVP112_429 [uncultured Caudovirales phage]